MVRILFFDTETNGLRYIANPDGSRKKKIQKDGKEIEVRPTSYDQPGSVWPAILSICWKIYDLDTKTEEKSVYTLIRPSNSLRTHVSTEKEGLESWNIGAEEIHKITQTNAESTGTSLGPILNDFMTDVLSCDLVVAHNLQFDKHVILNALKGRSVYVPSAWPKEKEFCTFLKARIINDSMIKLVETPTGPYPSRSLDNLYRSFVSEELPGGAHNAERDVRVLVDVFFSEKDGDKIFIDMAREQLDSNASAAAATTSTEGGRRRLKRTSRKSRKRRKTHKRRKQ